MKIAFEKIKPQVKENMNRYLINLTLLLVAFGGLYRGGYNNDTVLHMVRQEADIRVRMECGRFLDAFFDWILYKLGVSTTTNTGLSVVLGLFLLAAALCIVQRIFLPLVKTDSVFKTLSFYAVTGLVFVNGLFSEYHMFSELSVWFAVSYLLVSLGALLFTKKRYGWALLLFFLSTHFYQVAVVYGAILLSAWIFLSHDRHITWKTVKEEVLCGFLTFGSGILNILSIEAATRLGVIDSFTKGMGLTLTLDKLKICLDAFIRLLRDSGGLLPGKWLPLLLFAVGIGITLYHLIREKDWGGVFYYALLVPAMVCMLYALPLAQAGVYLPPRIVAPFYTIQSMVLLIALSVSSKGTGELARYVCCGWLAVQLIFCNVIVTNRYVSNTLDRIYIQMVYEEILEYEEETGIEVTKFAVSTDGYSPAHYDEVYYKMDQINERIMGIATNCLMEVETGRKLEKVPMDATIYAEHFAGNDWKYFDAEEQLLIIDDTAYLVVF